MPAQSKRTRKSTIRDSNRQPPRYGLGLVLRVAYRALMNDFQARLAQLGYTHSEFLYLSLLRSRARMTLSELATHAGVHKASATDVLKLLTAKELIERQTDETDSRRQYASLTVKGRKVFEVLVDSAVATNDIARADISDAEFAQFHEVLRKITANFKSRSK
jgi:DNA-binding MarR family transcriptional regulator